MGTEDEQDHVVQLKRSEIKALQDRAKEADDASARAQAAERKLAFAEVGINPSDAKLSYFVKGYDGELTADAIRTAAVEAGFIEAPGAGSGGSAGPSAEEVAAHQRITDAASGSAGSVDTAGRVDFADAIRTAKSPEDVVALLSSAPTGAHIGLSRD